MKTKIIFSTLAVCFFFLTSCSNDDSDGENNIPVTEGFTWTENGSSTVRTAAKAKFSTQYKTFMIQDVNDALLFEINLDGTTAATYSWGNSNAFTYTAVNPFFIATAGSMIVTSNASGKISGTFTASGTGGNITEIQGAFTNVEVVP